MPRPQVDAREADQPLGRHHDSRADRLVHVHRHDVGPGAAPVLVTVNVAVAVPRRETERCRQSAVWNVVYDRPKPNG